MDYNYETLNDQSFQKLAQAVLVKAFPDAQCLPVGQPDGGRDAFVFVDSSDESEKKRTIIFQVKFSLNPRGKVERDAVLDVIKSESNKVLTLKKYGVYAYYLITNVVGTAHLASGSIDQANELLSNAFGVPSFCWWRDDLDARISGNSDIKWSFPTILKGADILQLVVEGFAYEQAEERAAAVRAYMAAQYRDDEEVKFKQVELQNKLLNLFVDLPISTLKFRHQSIEGVWAGSSMHAPIYNLGLKKPISKALVLLSDDVVLSSHKRNWSQSFLDDRVSSSPFWVQAPQLNAAQFFLTKSLNTEPNRFVLEGAPGQGKSTITQYVCQVNRARILERDRELADIPAEHKGGPIRLPFRIDLRDYATWLGGKNPFVGDGTSVGPSPALPSALEAFIAAQVSYASGGHEFSVADFSIVLRKSHIIIVLDGFDEVADIPTRSRIVEEISRAQVRIGANSKSAQMLVTSRPAAFANSPGFPENDWAHFELQAMTSDQIEAYARRWMTARRLASRERGEFLNLLNEKLEQPHMRTLARNPMQLTILLALIHTRGLSLPDKRTALYDSYMELFFNREAEKSRIVREHRDLLIQIHRYLAWYLHAQAEGGDSRGMIAEEHLRALLGDFLTSQGHKTTLLDDLFTGMVERVVAVVSRVQGTFEFEVQPLREYFAARYLYDTAPYSPPGSERRGTKPERFRALVRNFYWLNVARFFCGCFSSGELLDLALELKQLSESDEFSLLSNPRLFSLMLLGDWVFSQQPVAVRQVVEQVSTQPGFKIVLASEPAPGTLSQFALPEKCGREYFVERCFRELECSLHFDEQSVFSRVIRDNATYDEMLEWWLSRGESTRGTAKWFDFAMQLQLFHRMPHTQISEILDEFGEQAVVPLVRSIRLQDIYSNVILFERTLSMILDGSRVDFNREGPSLSELEFLEILLKPATYLGLLKKGARGSAQALLRRDESLSEVPSLAIQSTEELKGAAEKVRAFIRSVDEMLAADDVRVWGGTLGPWSLLLDLGISTFGPQWVFARLAVFSAAIRGSMEKGYWTEYGWSLRADSAQIVRYARFKAGNARWWGEQLEAVQTESEKLFLLLTLFVWGTPRTIVTLSDRLGTLLEGLSAVAWYKLYSGAGAIGHLVSGDFDDASVFRSIKLSPRLAIVLGGRVSLRLQHMIFDNQLQTYSGGDPDVLEYCSGLAVATALEGKLPWVRALEFVGRAYDAQRISPPQDGNLKLPKDFANEVCEHSRRYPNWLIRVAQRQLAEQVGARAAKLLDVAESEKWFDAAYLN